MLPPEVSQYFIPLRSEGPAGATLTYQPVVLGAAEIHYSKAKSVDLSQELTLLANINDGPVAVNLDQATVVDLPVEDLENAPVEGAGFADLPAAASKAKNYDSWRKDFALWLYRNQKVELFESPSLDLISNPGESERDFRVRLQQLSREKRDEAVEKLRQKYAPKVAALEERKRRAEQAVEREAEQAQGQKVQTAISFGATLLSSFFGRKSLNLSTLGRATTAARGVSRTMKETSDVDRAQETVEAVNQQLADLDARPLGGDVALVVTERGAEHAADQAPHQVLQRQRDLDDPACTGRWLPHGCQLLTHRNDLLIWRLGRARTGRRSRAGRRRPGCRGW